MSASTRGRTSRRAPAQRSPRAMSTEDILRNVVFAKRPRDERPGPTGGAAHAGLGYGAGGASGAPAPHEPDSRPVTTTGTAATPSGDIPPVLGVHCAFTPEGRLRAKQEHCGGRITSYDYTHDERGHLTEVRRDGQVAERYAYNAAGQRTEARVAPLPGMSRDALRAMETERTFAYDAAGRLVRAGRARYMYAPDGSLRCTEEGRNSTWFYYGNGGNADAGGAPHHPQGQLAPVALDSVVLPGGDIIRYRFGQHGMPFLVLRNDAPSEEYQWLDPLRLARFRDHRTGSDYTFHYGNDRVPEAVTVCGPALDNLDGNLLDLPIFRKDGEAAPPPRSVTFRIGRDQVGTVKVLMDPDGKVVKRMEYDSFGNLLLDTCPYFYLPLGFAGGLVDRHTGLVRFGFRDYDPRAGRFTAPDPLGDTGGDHDPYDYCVDDPVSAFDPLGLEGAGIARNVAPFWAPYGSKEKQRVQEILGDKGQELRKGMKSIQALDEATSPISWGFAVPDLVDAVLQETKRIWKEIDHPRDKNTGEFIDK